VGGVRSSPVQFVREYYEDDYGYPNPEDQTDEWKKDMIDLYVLIAGSICKAYPVKRIQWLHQWGFVSFSDMQDFDWDEYEMGTKERNSDIGSLIPNKLARMITMNPDKKMIKFYDDMTPLAQKKFGVEQYVNFQAWQKEKVISFPRIYQAGCVEVTTRKSFRNGRSWRNSKTKTHDSH
jgi:hypothetical protein